MKNTKNNLTGAIVFIIVGIFLIVIGIPIVKHSLDFSNYIKTTATISKITTTYDYDYDYDYDNPHYEEKHDVFIKYTVDENEYTAKLDSYSSFYYEGMKINIYYNKTSPSQIKTKGGSYASLLVPGFGILSLVAGIMALNQLKKDKNS